MVRALKNIRTRQLTLKLHNRISDWEWEILNSIQMHIETVRPSKGIEEDRFEQANIESPESNKVQNRYITVTRAK